MYYTELRLSTPVGRKNYRCEWCNESIPKGEKHVYRVYTYDGFQQDRMHQECFKAMSNIKQEDWDNEFYPGQFERGTDRDRDTLYE